MSNILRLALFPGEHENARLKRINEEDRLKPCVFCRRSEVDEINLGPLYESDGVVTHYFCMMFSAGLSQQGNTDADGILGFLPNAILSEVRRATRLKCIYCHMTGAAIGCCDRRCKATFHFPCGLRNGAHFQFYGNFESFCINHSKKRVVENLTPDLECPICFVPHDDTKDIIVGECCKSAIFHRMCVQKHAFSAGYFFKCPICSSLDSFKMDMKQQGIFVPEQDAAWEREPNAYQELLQQYSKCDAVKCLCPKGNEYGAMKGKWLLARCRVCGASGTHRECGKLATIDNWTCADCLKVVNRVAGVKENDPKHKKRETKATKKVPDKTQTSTSSSGIQALNITSGGNKAKRTGTPAFLDMDNDWDINTITVVEACRDYFPHDKETVTKFYLRNHVIPDWRKLTLAVNIVDMFETCDNGKDDVKSTSTNKTRRLNSVAVKGSFSLNSSSETVPPKQRKDGKKRKAFSKRGSSWKNGILKKPKKSYSKTITDDLLISVNLSVEPSETSTSSKENDSISKKERIKPLDASSSKGVVEGIRRSQSSLMTFLSTASAQTVKSTDFESMDESVG